MTERRRIHAVSIRDFRGITALDLDFTDGSGAPLDVVVLAGANGCGKTSVLEAIAAGCGRTNLVDTGSQIRFGASEYSIVVRAGHETSTIRRKEHAGHLAVISAHTTMEYFSAGRALRPIDDGVDPYKTLESQRIEEFSRRLINLFYRSLRSRNSETPSIFLRLKDLWQRFDPHGRRLEVIPRDNNPGSGDVVVVCDDVPIPEDVTSFAMAKNLATTRSDIPKMVPLDALSSGQRALFAFAGPLIFRDEPAEIVLIDEPEQHMHVQWQRLLLPALRELCPDTQFIVATHSEEILDSVLSYERFILVDDEDPRAHIVEPGAAAE